MKILFRTVLHRLITYPALLPVMLVYKLFRNKEPTLAVFYLIRGFPHGPLNGNLRIASYSGLRIIFPFDEDPFLDDVWLRNVYHLYAPQSDDVVIDVGAHMGFFAVKMANRVKIVVAFEPDPYNFGFLSMNIEYNRLSNVRAFNYGLANKQGHMFLKRGYSYGRTRLTETDTGHKVRVKPLDATVNELGIVPTAVKIDAEGYEMDVLRGAKVTLTRYKPKLIIASYHYPNEWKQVAKYLARMGFRCLVYQVPLTLQKAKETYIYAEFPH